MRRIKRIPFVRCSYVMYLPESKNSCSLHSLESKVMFLIGSIFVVCRHTLFSYIHLGYKHDLFASPERKLLPFPMYATEWHVVKSGPPGNRGPDLSSREEGACFVGAFGSLCQGANFSDGTRPIISYVDERKYVRRSEGCTVDDKPRRI